ncbi:DNA modification methylase [Bradyrhizobium barranii subsp. barranii]
MDRNNAVAPGALGANWAAWAPERRPLASLVPYARNARTHSEAQLQQIAASIREWGWTTPVLVDEAGMVIAGHGRLLAAERLGIREVPVIVARGWSEAQKRAYVIADNKLAANAGWDDALLKIEVADLTAMGFDLPLIGFSDRELARLTNSNPGLTDPDAVPDLPAEPVARRGDIWRLGRHRLVCGDATDKADVGRALAGVTPHLMVTDPPYGANYDPNWRERVYRSDGTKVGAGARGLVLNDDRDDWTEAWQLFPGDVAYVWHGALHVGVVEASLIASGFQMRAQIIWAKSNFAIGRGDYHWQHEPCWYAVRKHKTGHFNGARDQSTIWEIPKQQSSETGHSTQKPVECMKRPIENNSSEGQAVYDPFSGSGTTIIAAEMSARACHGIEINPAYVDVAVLRWQAFTGEQAHRESDGRRFSDLATPKESTDDACANDPDAAETVARQSGQATAAH